MSDCVVAGSTLTGVFSVTGLKTAGLVTEVSINDTTWTALPATPLSARNAISIQNVSAVEIKLNYSAVVGYVGVRLFPSGERFYDITDAIVLYAKAYPGAGTVTIVIEELS